MRVVYRRKEHQGILHRYFDQVEEACKFAKRDIEDSVRSILTFPQYYSKVVLQHQQTIALVEEIRLQMIAQADAIIESAYTEKDELQRKLIYSSSDLVTVKYLLLRDGLGVIIDNMWKEFSKIFPPWPVYDQNNKALIFQALIRFSIALSLSTYLVVPSRTELLEEVKSIRRERQQKLTRWYQNKHYFKLLAMALLMIGLLYSRRDIFQFIMMICNTNQ